MKSREHVRSHHKKDPFCDIVTFCLVQKYAKRVANLGDESPTAQKNRNKKIKSRAHLLLYKRLASALLRLAHCCCVSSLLPVSVPILEPESPWKGSFWAILYSFRALRVGFDNQGMSNQLSSGGARSYSNSWYYLRLHHTHITCIDNTCRVSKVSINSCTRSVWWLRSEFFATHTS